MENGAVWNIEYVEGKGFALKNVGTGKYLKDAGNANHDEPTYFSFCTLATATGIQSIKIDAQRSLSQDGSLSLSKGPNTTLYDLQGRQVTTPRQGLYIRNGKKIIIK